MISVEVDKNRPLERTPSKDLPNRATSETDWGKIREAVQKVLATESGYQKGFTFAGAANKHQSVFPCAAYTIDGFCSAHSISKAQLYVLFGRGEGPKTYTVGRRRYISLAAAAEWVCRNEALTAALSTRGAAR